MLSNEYKLNLFLLHYFVVENDTIQCENLYGIYTDETLAHEDMGKLLNHTLSVDYDAHVGMAYVSHSVITVPSNVLLDINDPNINAVKITYDYKDLRELP